MTNTNLACRALFLLITCTIYSLSFSQEKAGYQDNSGKTIIDQEKGFIICNGGGTNQPLFSKECKELTLYRVALGGGIKYEGLCLDASDMTFFIACDAVHFEFNRKLPLTKKNSWGTLHNPPKRK